MPVGQAGTLAAEQRAAAMTPANAAEYALLLAVGEPQSPATGEEDAAPGPAPRERELVTLVAQGRTDAQIAAPTAHHRAHGEFPPGPP